MTKEQYTTIINLLKKRLMSAYDDAEVRQLYLEAVLAKDRLTLLNNEANGNIDDINEYITELECIMSNENI